MIGLNFGAQEKGRAGRAGYYKQNTADLDYVDQVLTSIRPPLISSPSSSSSSRIQKVPFHYVMTPYVVSAYCTGRFHSIKGPRFA